MKGLCLLVIISVVVGPLVASGSGLSRLADRLRASEEAETDTDINEVSPSVLLQTGDTIIPATSLPDRFSVTPKTVGKRSFWNIAVKKGGTRSAKMVSRNELQNIIAFDQAATQKVRSAIASEVAAGRMRRIERGSRYHKKKMLPAHYHTVNLVSPVQSAVEADVKGSDGVYVEPNVIGSAPAAGTRAPKYRQPIYTPYVTKGPLSRLANNKVKRPKVHYIPRAPARGPQRPAHNIARIAVPMGKAFPSGATVRPPKPLARRNTPRSIARQRGASLSAKRAARRAAYRRAQARAVARAMAPNGRARRRSQRKRAPRKPRQVVQDIVNLVEEKVKASAAGTNAAIASVKADTTNLVSGQKRLIDYAVTATRSNPIAERSVEIDEQILKHVSILENALQTVLADNKAMHDMQRANLAQLKALQSSVNQVQARDAAIEKVVKASNPKQFPRLAAVSVTEEQANVIDQFHDTLTNDHTAADALDNAILTHSARFAEEQEEEADEADTEESGSEAETATVKTEEEITMEKLMTGFVQSNEEESEEEESETEEEADDEADDEAEEETESEEEEEEADEEESEDESDEENEQNEETEGEALIESSALTPVESEAEAQGEPEFEAIDAESNKEEDILRLAEQNAAMVERQARRVASDSAMEAAEEEAAQTDEQRAAPISLELSADETEGESDADEAEGAEMLGLPALPSSVPNEVHDDLSEVEAEVDAEEEEDQSESRFAEVNDQTQQTDSESESDNDEESDGLTAKDDAEFDALMHDEDTAAATAEVEKELANEDASDVNDDVSVADIDKELDAVTTDVATSDAINDPLAGNKDLAALRATVALIQQQLSAVKAEGAAMAKRHDD